MLKNHRVQPPPASVALEGVRKGKRISMIDETIDKPVQLRKEDFAKAVSQASLVFVEGGSGLSTSNTEDPSTTTGCMDPALPPVHLAPV
jgi:hypothetical protein